LVSTKNCLNTHIPFVSICIYSKLKERFITPKQTFAQIYQVQIYGQFKMHGNVINVPLNLNKIQLVLPQMPKDETTLGLIIKKKFEYRSPYTFGNIWLIQVMYALKNLPKIPLYEDATILI